MKPFVFSDCDGNTNFLPTFLFCFVFFCTVAIRHFTFPSQLVRTRNIEKSLSFDLGGVGKLRRRRKKKGKKNGKLRTRKKRRKPKENFLLVF